MIVKNRALLRHSVLLVWAVVAGLTFSGITVGMSDPAPATEAPSISTPQVLTALPATPLEKSVPIRLRVPAIGLDTELVGLGLETDGTMGFVRGPSPASWYTGAPTPGEIGPAIIAGHVHWNADNGVFSKLDKLKPGDTIDVTRKDGIVATFRITKVSEFDKSAFPTNAVYGNIDHPGLRLITCGDLNPTTYKYDSNLVVFAELVASPSL